MKNIMKNKKKSYAIKSGIFLALLSLFAFNHFNEGNIDNMATE